jgi:hypothetical protein
MFNIHRTREKNIDKEYNKEVKKYYRYALENYKNGEKSSFATPKTIKDVSYKLNKKGIKHVVLDRVVLDKNGKPKPTFDNYVQINFKESE